MSSIPPGAPVEGSAAYGGALDDGAAPQRSRSRRRRTVVLASVLAGALVLGGGAVALAVAGALGGGEEAGAARPSTVSEREIRLEPAWELAADPVHETFGEPIPIDGAIVFTSRPGGDAAEVRLIDASDGTETWSSMATMAGCAADTAGEGSGEGAELPSGAVCALTTGLGQGPTEVVVLTGEGERSSATVDASAGAMGLVDDDVLLLDGHSLRDERVIRVDRGGRVVSEHAPGAEELVSFADGWADGDDSGPLVSERYGAEAIEDMLARSPDLVQPSRLWDASGGVLVETASCDDCEAAAVKFVFFAAVEVAAEVGESETAATADARPAGMPDCPADTELLAWAEFADGWVLVCGVDAAHPGYLAVQLPGASRPLLSRGAAQPAAAEARAAVRWDEHLQRYTADLADGSLLVLEDDTGTMAIWAGAEHASDKAAEEWVRRIFVPWKEERPRVFAAPEAVADGGANGGSDAGANRVAGGGSLVIPGCAAMNPGLSAATGASPVELGAAGAEIFGPVVRTALQGASARTGCEWRTGSGSAMQWVSVITPEQKNALIDGMLDFGYRAEADGPLLRVGYTQSGEHHTHVFEGNAWIFIYQAGVEGDHSQTAIDAVRESNPGRG